MTIQQELRPPGADSVGRHVPGWRSLTVAKLVGREMRLRWEMDTELNEADWMILLHVYVAMIEAPGATVEAAAHASRSCNSSAKRHIRNMVDRGLLIKRRSTFDRRVTNLTLTRQGLSLVGRMIDNAAELRSSSMTGNGSIVLPGDYDEG